MLAAWRSGADDLFTRSGRVQGCWARIFAAPSGWAPVRFRAAATDLVKAQPHLFERGELADAMMASLAVPTVFAPVHLDGTLYADGLLFDNLPVREALGLGAQHLVVVDLTTPIGEKRSYESVANVAIRLLDISVCDNMRQQLAALRPDDLLLRPDVSGIGNPVVYEAARRCLETERRGLAPGFHRTARAAPRQSGELCDISRYNL